METFEIRLLVRKKKRRRKIDSFHSLCTRGAMYLLQIVHSNFPRMVFCWPSSYSKIMISLASINVWGKARCPRCGWQLALTAQGSAFEHTCERLSAEGNSTLCLFPKPLMISPDKEAVRSNHRLPKCADDHPCPVKMEEVKGVQVPEPRCSPHGPASLSPQEQAGHFRTRQAVLCQTDQLETNYLPT